MKNLSLCLLIVTILISACSNEKLENNKSTYEVTVQDETNKDETNKDETDKVVDEELATELIEAFLNKIYTIDNPQDYAVEKEMMIESALDSKEYYWGYEDYCSENGLLSVIGNRMPSMYREVALTKNFRMSLDELKYDVSYRNDLNNSILNQHSTIVYEYTASLLLEYGDGNKEVIDEEGAINVKYIDGDWKVDEFKLKVYNDLWIGDH